MKIFEKDGTIRYRNKDGKLHRLGGPAVIKPDGYKAWWICGKRSNKHGPSIVRADGSKFWYFGGNLTAISYNADIFPQDRTGLREIYIVGKSKMNSYIPVDPKVN